MFDHGAILQSQNMGLPPSIFKMIFIIVRKFGPILKRPLKPPVGDYALFRLERTFKFI